MIDRLKKGLGTLVTVVGLSSAVAGGDINLHGQQAGPLYAEAKSGPLTADDLDNDHSESGILATALKNVVDPKKPLKEQEAQRTRVVGLMDLFENSLKNISKAQEASHGMENSPKAMELQEEMAHQIDAVETYCGGNKMDDGSDPAAVKIQGHTVKELMDPIFDGAPDSTSVNSLAYMVQGAKKLNPNYLKGILDEGKDKFKRLKLGAPAIQQASTDDIGGMAG
jgi:hypothetical protein